ncbi:hypothetical protein TRICI_003888 [Trichomonascus ciferrii]|uniref:Rho-GAP domain-containing protein n=1 Tax=Trichomonascus ciferrii TaxID=44093 RepID=A0A642V2G1_9ASCO|nr:hypothetical protein TRICI_003888 [Trichomonascus ciferrii]
MMEGKEKRVLSYNEIQRLADKVVHISRTFDPSTRLPIVVVDSTQFPPPQSDVYSQLVGQVLERLPKTNYVVVFFACGAPNKPSWSWVAKTYSMLDRPTKKRIKKLYVVHESWWVRAVTEMLRGVVSSKFKRKIVHVSSLSQLAQHIDITLIDIKPAVYTHNNKVERQITIPRHSTPVFGVNINYYDDSFELPQLWYDVFSYLGVTAPNTKSIFNNLEYEHEVELVYILKEAYDRGHLVDLDDYGPQVTASLLKLYLYKLPSAIIPIDKISLPLQDSIDYTLHIWDNLPLLSRHLLPDVLSLLTSIVAHASRTMQSPTTLAMSLVKCLTGVSATNKEASAIATRYCRNLIEFWPNICQKRDNYDSENPFASPTHSRNTSVELNIKKRPFAHKASSASMSSSYGSLPFYAISKNNSTPELRTEQSLIDLNDTEQDLDPFTTSSRTSSSSSSASSVIRPTKTSMGPPPVPAKSKAAVAAASASILRPSQKPNINDGPSPTETKPPPSSPPKPKFGPRSKSVAPTRRGKMVAELAKLYEEKGHSAQILVQLDRSKSSKT